jgi:hypothetical protein
MNLSPNRDSKGASNLLRCYSQILGDSYQTQLALEIRSGHYLLLRDDISL